ncbi:hypothetical protein [Aquitalea pelogenes]|uniref:hypothetical protein n=1 Tax=Aquitalea pelogenes TaxID=1293573 RepID=UPI0007877659|nr:hypothetical protein [Aquitalea pelogenes]
MDILYYWKKADQDILTGKIGWLCSEQGVLAELAATPADYLWLVKTPQGYKGQLELLGRVCLVDQPVLSVPKLDACSVVYYDPYHRYSVWFDGADPARNRLPLTAWMRRHFPSAISGNFQGANGVQPLRGDVLLQLQKLAASLPARPFNEMAVATSC